MQLRHSRGSMVPLGRMAFGSQPFVQILHLLQNSRRYGPLARALLKKTVNDEVAVSLPLGHTVYTILEISYSPLEKAG